MNPREQVRAWVERLVRLTDSRLVRRIGIGIGAILILFSLAGFVGVPLIVRHVVLPKLAVSLHRPVSAGKIWFNPYSLRLRIGKLHIGDRDSSQAFFDLRRINARASWMSLFRRAPIIREIIVDQPRVHLVRTGANRFNFSDLTESSAQSTPSTTKPRRFSISNIQLRNGDIRFEDKVTGQEHKLQRIRLNIPFIANLPADVNIYVQPLLQMVVDGSPLRIGGKAKPFAVPPESVLDINLHRLQLPRFLGYVPGKLPIKMPGGTLSSALELHFINSPGHPVIRVAGVMALERIDVRDSANLPLLALDHAAISFIDLEPLEKVAHLSKIRINDLSLNVIRNRDGTINFNSLQSARSNQKPSAGGGPAAAAPSSRAPPSTANPVQITPNVAQSIPTSSVAQQASPFDFSLDSFELNKSKVDFTDNSGAKPAKLALQDIHIGIKDLRTVQQKAPAPFEIDTRLGGGGNITIKGDLDLAQSRTATELAVDQVDLPALQDFAQAILAGRIAAGKLSTHLNAQAQFGNQFNLHVEPAEASIDNFELQSPHAQEPPIKWDRLSVTLDQMDLAHHQATVKEIRSQGLALFVRRERDGKLSLTSLLTPSASSIPEAQPSSSPHNRPAQSIEAGGFNKLKSKSVGSDHPGPSGPSNSWQYKIESVVLERAAIRGEDDAAAHQVSVAVAPLNIHLQNVSSDPARQSSIETDGIINGTGNFKINGTVTPKPLKADLRVMTRAIDCAIADPYVSNQFNATIKRALLFINGRLGVVQEPRNLRLSYRGDAGLGKVMLLDRLTRGPLLRWRRFSADRINFESGAGQPKIHIGSLALSDFDASILLNQDGHLNLRDITGSSQSPTASQQQAEQQQQSSKSVTKAKPTPPGSTTGASTPAAGASASSAPRGIPANIEIGRITLQGGNINYADNFIRPNYSANLTGISGKIGSFGTKSTAPAEVALAGQINGNSPINIDGSINPLLPMAFLDIKAKANGIELPEFTPYSTKYTGYPIVKGALTVDVHYLLDQQKLTAENHIFIDQLTFGDKVENSSATNLPIRLAVSLLKDARGQIDLRVPVSGSLNDPHFSIGAVILHAFVNLIMKAATAPFSLLASAIGKSGGTTGDDYSRIIFDPGWATLSPQNQTKIDALAKMLKDRPALKLNITGRVDPRFDVNGLREATVTRAVGEQKSKAMGGDESGESPAINVSADEYDKYLARAYKAADFAKPRNAIGLTKSLPPDEMKKLMLEHVSVTNDDLRKLAVARADAVEKALAAKIEPSRLAVIAPKLNADDIKDKSKTTRLDLSFQ